MGQLNATERKRIAIIGAGIVGVSAAIYLQRDGHDVVLIDKQGPAGETSYGNGGILVSSGVVPINSPGLIKNAPGMLLRRDSPLFVHWPYLPKMLPWLIRYMLRANARDARQVGRALAPLLNDSIGQHRALANGTGAEKWIEPSDYVFVYNSRAAYEKDAFAWSLRREMGFEWDEMDAEEFGNYEPMFAGKNKFAIRLGEHGRVIDPGQYVTDLATHFTQLGGEMVIADAHEIVHERGRVSGIKTNGDLINCDTVVIAAGAWSKGLMEKLGVKVPMETERGYHIELVNPSEVPESAMMVAAGKFVITPMLGRIRCAGIVEFGGLEAPASQAPVDLLKKHVRELLPDLKYDRIDEWLGHRPAPSDSIPFIGPVDNIPNVYAAFGHHHVGMSAGPRTGQLVADMIANRETKIDISPYRVGRFTH
jgi:D-amino-acid dehydrogenase